MYIGGASSNWFGTKNSIIMTKIQLYRWDGEEQIRHEVNNNSQVPTQKLKGNFMLQRCAIQN